jgi:hypothetical protein
MAGIAFPIHVWAIVIILITFPSWLLRLSMGELVGAISYPLVDALLESSILLLGFVLLAFILPSKWLADKFVALSSALAWLLAAWAVLVQFIYVRIVQWGPEKMIPGSLLVVFSFGLVYWLVQRYDQLGNLIKRLVQGLMVLAYLYLIFDMLGLVVVIVRNL